MEIMIDSMFNDREEYLNNLGRTTTFGELVLINWAFREFSKEKAEEYLNNKFAVKKKIDIVKEEKISKVKNNKDEVT